MVQLAQATGSGGEDEGGGRASRTGEVGPPLAAPPARAARLVEPTDAPYTTTTAAALALGCTSEYVRQLVLTGRLEGFSLHLGPATREPRFPPERPRKSTRGRWLISVASIEQFIAKRVGLAGVDLPTWRPARSRGAARLQRALHRAVADGESAADPQGSKG
jgi:hypothetical protein